jgi:hypothetical protein
MNVPTTVPAMIGNAVEGDRLLVDGVAVTVADLGSVDWTTQTFVVIYDEDEGPRRVWPVDFRRIVEFIVG